MNKHIGLICASNALCSTVGLLKSNGCIIRALWCPHTDLCMQTAAENDISFISNQPKEVIQRNDVRLVIIISQPTMQLELCLLALDLNKHIVCNASTIINISDANRLSIASNTHPNTLALPGYGMPHMQPFIEMRNRLQHGYIGRPLVVDIHVTMSPPFTDHYDWTCEDCVGGGILQLVGSHIIDLLAYVLDRRASRVVHAFIETYASRQRIPAFRRLNADDYCSFILMHPHTVSASICINATVANAPFEQRIAISGSNGRLRTVNLELWGMQGNGEQLLFDGGGVKPSTTGMTFYDDAFECMLQRLLCSSTSTITNVGETGGFDNLRYVTRTIDAVRRASDCGHWVTIDSDDDSGRQNVDGT